MDNAHIILYVIDSSQELAGEEEALVASTAGIGNSKEVSGLEQV